MKLFASALFWLFLLPDASSAEKLERALQALTAQRKQVAGLGNELLCPQK